MTSGHRQQLAALGGRLGLADLQGAVQAAADEMVASGAETGLQVAVRHRGRVVAEVASGVADPRTGAEVRPGTPRHPRPKASRPRSRTSWPRAVT